MKCSRNSKQHFEKPSKLITSGFSLIELLVSITLLSLVISLLYSAFFQISDHSLKVKSSLQGRQELRLLMKIVLDDLQSVRYLEHLNLSGQNKLKETGISAIRVSASNRDEASSIAFHAAIPTRFFQDIEEVRQGKDPQLHEVGYFLEQDPGMETWNLIRREDFYIDDSLWEGGRTHVISSAITRFDLSFLESETSLAGGGFEEVWVDTWDSPEKNCTQLSVDNSFCLPRAIRLSMGLLGEDGSQVEDSMTINLCVRPCKEELFK